MWTSENMSCNESELGRPPRQKRQFGQRALNRRSELSCRRLSTAVHLTFMNALSRREEDTLLKTTKARALAECDSIVKGSAMDSCMIKDTNIGFVSLRIRQLCNRTHSLYCVGLQGQVQGITGVYASIVSLTSLVVQPIE